MEGYERVKNDSHDRHTTSITEQKIGNIRDLIEGKQRSVSGISSEVRISYRSPQTIITNDLRFREVST